MRRYLVVAALCLLWMAVSPRPVITAAGAPGSATEWTVENVQAWGDKQLAVDFGPKGVWNYSGTWIQLSRWNPRIMEAWGGHGLAADFGAHGLWTYDGRVWTKITR